MADTPFFSVGGLASGLDTASIVDGLTKLEQKPLDTLRAQQTGFQSQISLIGNAVSSITALQNAAKALASSGTMGVKTSSTNTDFTATASSKATAGSFSISVQWLASAAQSRSAAFASDTAAVTGGTLNLTVQGVTYDPITISDGESLADVAGDIRALGAPISAVVLNDGTRSYLSITNLSTGYTGSDPSAALQINESYTGTQGQQLGLTTTHAATNAAFTIDGLAFTRQSNTITDAISGTTLALKAQTNTSEKLTLDYDTSATAANLGKFVNSYNALLAFAQGQLSAGGAGTDRSSTLAGDSTLRSLISSVQSLLTSTVSGGGTVRTLADIGLKTNFQDGSISIDQTKLQSAITANAGAVNNLFSQSTTGIGALAQQLSDRYTNVVDGLFTSRTKNLSSRIRQMDRQAEQMQLRVDAFKQNLIAQFTAMEKIVGGLKTTGNYLTQQSAQQTK